MFKTHRTFDLSTGVKNNTIAVVHGKTLTVVYHKTIVVERTGKKITLRDGGWETISTRHVINNALRQMGLRMWLEKKKINKVNTLCFVDADNNVTLPWVSGMTVNL